MTTVNMASATGAVRPRWWVVMCIGTLVGSLIIASFVIVRLWLWVYPLQSQTAVQASTNTPVAQSLDDWDAIDLTLEDLPEGNDALTVTTNTWQKFASRTLPIRFQYPADWQLWEGTTPLSDYIQIADYESIPEDAFAEIIPGHKFEVTVLIQPIELGLEQWIKDLDQDFVDPVGTIEDLTVDSFPAKLSYHVLGYSTYGSIFIPLGDGTDRVMSISLYGPEVNFEDLRPLLDSILSTVQITS